MSVALASSEFFWQRFGRQYFGFSRRRPCRGGVFDAVAWSNPGISGAFSTLDQIKSSLFARRSACGQRVEVIDNVTTAIFHLAVELNETKTATCDAILL